jgi:hypothetical protein
LEGNVIHALAATYRTDILRSVGGYDEDLFAEDWDMHIRLSLKTEIYYDAEYISAKYRILQNSLNNDPKKRAQALDSSCRSLSKFLGIKKDCDQIILRTIEGFAKELKQIGSEKWRRWFRFLFIQNPNKKTLGYFLKSTST